MALRPWRGPGPGRPDVPLPPDRMPLLRGGRPLKRWTYIGAYGPELMLCAARAWIGGVPIAWWAVWDRGAGRLVQRTARGSGGVEVSGERVVVRDRFELSLDVGGAVEVVSPHGSEYIWTRKRVGVAQGSVLGRTVRLAALVDESAGYHARRTAWMWSAGVGEAASGAAVAWNLVDGIHDDPDVSERTVWVDGVPHAVPHAGFDGLAGVGELRFTAEAVRARRENLVLMRSDYEQPFGTFAGSLPVAGPLREGWGVMERHEVLW
jgi:uncharacterized protein DUF2804